MIYADLIQFKPEIWLPIKHVHAYVLMVIWSVVTIYDMKNFYALATRRFLNFQSLAYLTDLTALVERLPYKFLKSWVL